MQPYENESKYMKKNTNLSKFLIEFTPVFIAVVFTFAKKDWTNRGNSKTVLDVVGIPLN